MTIDAVELLDSARERFLGPLRASVEAIADPQMRLIAAYHFGWVDAGGEPNAKAGGKMLRPALALLSGDAVGNPTAGIAPAVAVELVHNFSLLHDDIMDGDETRRHRPTGWVVYGVGAAILAGNAMLTAAFEELVRAGEPGLRTLPGLLDTVQLLIAGQSADLALENDDDVDLDRVLRMEAGKTAALMARSCAIGAIAAGAASETCQALEGFGHETGMAFQLVDDILGISGDSSETGKSSSSDLRAGKRSAPIVASLTSGTSAGNQLAGLLADGPPAAEDDVRLAAKLVEEAGGLRWAADEADRCLERAHAHLDRADISADVRTRFTVLADYVVNRNG